MPEKSKPEVLPHSIRTSTAGLARRAALVRSLYETTSYDKEPTLEEAMRATEAGSDDDD